MLELKNITKDYKVADSATTVLKGISLTFRNNEFVSILGPSGCGKTTMLNIIGGLDKFTTGDLVINGKSTKEYKDRDWDTYRNHEIGFVFQSYNLIPHQTILKNVELALSISGISRKERKQLAIDALTRVGLKDHLNKKPNQLSGGQCQRVSIARAIVNNPNIIMADEPTGALDSETSMQVMELLKEIAQDRLVIMVTHNAELAKKYSTRIVKMLDGQILEDSNPVSENEKKEFLKIAKEREEHLTKKEKKLKERKSSMSSRSTLALSGSNLRTKKKRTFITSLACSIGIIGIAIILSVSGGMSTYVNKLQQDSSSSSYITISNTTTSKIEFGDDEDSDANLVQYPNDTTGIYPYTEQTSTSSSKPQILSEDYINYIEKNINGETDETSLVLGISYTKDVALNLITKNDDTYSVVDDSYFSEMLDNTEYLSTQYTILAGEKLPSEYNEVALVVDSYNRLSTKVLTALGIEYDENASEISYDKLVGKKFKLIANNDFYEVSTGAGDNNRDVYSSIKTQEKMATEYDNENSLTIKIVSVIRQNEDASSDWVDCGIAYTSALTNKVIELNQDSAIVTYQKENDDYNVLTGNTFESENSSSSGGLSSLFGSSGTSYNDNLISLGAVSTPSKITIYPKDFDSKDKILEVLDAWNNTEIYKLYGNELDEEGNYIAEAYKVEYTDISALMASMLGSLINIITYVLVAFSAVSLVVSSIMIAIITYASVIERIKEIGVIRSLGGRKKDISRLFISEACIIGVISAIIALVVTLLLNSVINLVLGSLVGVSTIATLKFSTAFWMVLLSIGLNLVASLVPASIAAKKDPVVALRTE